MEGVSRQRELEGEVMEAVVSCRLTVPGKAVDGAEGNCRLTERE